MARSSTGNFTRPLPLGQDWTPDLTTNESPAAASRDARVARPRRSRRSSEKPAPQIDGSQLALRLFPDTAWANPVVTPESQDDNHGNSDGSDDDSDADASALGTRVKPSSPPSPLNLGNVVVPEQKVPLTSLQDALNWPVFAQADTGLITAHQHQDQTDQWKLPAKFAPRKYGRNYAAYDLAQQKENSGFLKLLFDLCEGIYEPSQTLGRPRMSMPDMVYAIVHKVYSLFSLRRHTSDLEQAHSLGYIDKIPNFNTVCKYMQLPEVTHILMDLITASSLPMKDLETQVLFDSSGFSTSRFVRWFNKRWGKVTDNREWVKLHIACGANTKIVTSALISDWQAHDTNFFKPLLERTLEHFNPESLSADKAYLSAKNIHLAMLAGVVPYIPFKSNTRIPTERSDRSWAQMYHYFRFNREDFYRHYHQRSNVETAFSMIKSKFGDSIRSKNYVAQVNEVLAKVLCHNIVEVHKVAIHLGMDPAESSVSQAMFQQTFPWQL